MPAPESERPPQGEVSTQTLLSELDRGDAEAARILFQRHQPNLLRRASGHPWMRALGGRLGADDVVQEVFSRALASGLLSAREARAPGTLAHALGVVLERVLADQLRQAGALKRGGNEEALSIDGEAERTEHPLLGQLVSTATTPTVNARSAELLRLCRDRLEEGEWEVWRLRVVAGLGFEEIAALIGGTDAAARGVLHRAKKKLILALAELDPEGEA